MSVSKLMSCRAGIQRGLFLDSLSGGSRRLHTSVVRMGFGSHTSDNDPQALESEKRKNLQGKQKSTMREHPGWNEKLASDSEATVKAEKEDGSIEDLMKHTEKHLAEDHASGNQSGPSAQESDPKKKGHTPF